MARPGITQEQVLEAAQALLEAGTTPTVSAVRERIGSGSYTTISAHLAEWRTQNTQAPAQVPEMPERVRTALNQVWAQAATAAQEDLDTQRQALEVMRRELDKEQADMGAEIERLEQALEQEREKFEQQRINLDQAQNSVRDTQAEMLELKLDNARLSERAGSAERRAEELREQVQGLQQQLATLAAGKEEKPAPRRRTAKAKAKPQV